MHPALFESSAGCWLARHLSYAVIGAQRDRVEKQGLCAPGGECNGWQMAACVSAARAEPVIPSHKVTSRPKAATQHEPTA